MTTFDQTFGAQAGHGVAYATNAALALSRQVADRQKQLAQELRTPVVVEMPAKRSEQDEHTGEAEKDKQWSSTKPTQETGDAAQADTEPERRPVARLIDVRI